MRGGVLNGVRHRQIPWRTCCHGDGEQKPDVLQQGGDADNGEHQSGGWQPGTAGSLKLGVTGRAPRLSAADAYTRATSAHSYTEALTSEGSGICVLV